MSKETIGDDSRSQRVSELRAFVFSLNDAIADRLSKLGVIEESIINRVLSGQMSMIADKVPAYKLADRILAKSLRLNVRIYQRNLLYFSMRRRYAENELVSIGLTLQEVDRDWIESRAQMRRDKNSSADSSPGMSAGLAGDSQSAADDLLSEVLAETSTQSSEDEMVDELLAQSQDAS